ncbi:MAG: hypothetical protein RJQ09_17970 [Cyclobacteriaceae bacterium]
MRINYSIIFIITLIIAGCSSGKKALEQGNYYDAVMKSVDRLRKNLGHDKSKSTLRRSYPLAIAYYEDEISNITSSNDPFKWGRTVRSYELINNMYEEIRRSPGALKVISSPVNYYDKMERAKANAAEESYAAGLRKLNPNDRNLSKEAYFHFSDADNFVRGYKDVNDKMAEARFHATLKVLVEQIPVPRRYSLSGDFFQQKVEEFLHSGWSDRDFVRFFNPNEARNERLDNPDQVVVLAFDDFTVGNTYIKESTEQFVRDSVEVGEVTLEDGSTVPAYGSVQAKLTVFRKEVSSRGLLSMQILDGRNEAILASTKFPGTFVWYSEWGSFNGDERALTREQLAICQANEIPPPPPQDLFFEFTVPIWDQLTSALRRFYSRY